MHRLTVVQLLPALQSGGVERSTLEIAAALVRAGHRAVVVSAGGRLVQPLLDAGGEHLTLDIGRKSLLTLRHVVGLRRLFAELGADVVHARSRLPAWLGWYALRGMPAATRPRFVTTVHGLNSPSRYSAVMTYGERVICVSQTVNDYVRAHYPQTDPARVRIIPRGVDIAQFPRRLGTDRRARAWAQTLLPGLPADASLLLLPGRGTRLKGHADGLQLLAALRASGVPAWLWLPGAREPGREAYVRELEAEAARLGVAAAVAFTEPTARIAEAYAASDLVLQLSRKPEAFGRTVVEALAVGRPVLGWAHGGVGELLAELQPAGAVPAFDTAALHAQALGLLQRPPAPPAVLPYTLQAMQSATLKVYDELRR
ncbi:glycosyltransferase [Xanthomonas cannabis]|uniref:glycosyltransferase n=1 Tax=Xanthomonas cannabis TaxID=1885674 RepID=UPI00141B49DE|nr:glycosyltransferase [Xanthomonas cannabis]NIK18143.1 glycosyltransferase involved in cell wall biosynthesis [Xanthomonas cannabis]